jgi:uncharacterized protein YabN with tetrapyrrole methylase and pyrophosphatase domain
VHCLLVRSYKIQKKAAEVGFDWDDVSDAFSKVKEETSELLENYQGNDQPANGRSWRPINRVVGM